MEDYGIGFAILIMQIKESEQGRIRTPRIHEGKFFGFDVAACALDVGNKITFETRGLIVEKCLKVETSTCNWDYDRYDL